MRRARLQSRFQLRRLGPPSPCSAARRTRCNAPCLLHPTGAAMAHLENRRVGRALTRHHIGSLLCVLTKHRTKRRCVWLRLVENHTFPDRARGSGPLPATSSRNHSGEAEMHQEILARTASVAPRGELRQSRQSRQRATTDKHAACVHAQKRPRNAGPSGHCSLDVITPTDPAARWWRCDPGRWRRWRWGSRPVLPAHAGKRARRPAVFPTR